MTVSAFTSSQARALEIAILTYRGYSVVKTNMHLLGPNDPAWELVLPSGNVYNNTDRFRTPDLAWHAALCLFSHDHRTSECLDVYLAKSGVKITEDWLLNGSVIVSAQRGDREFVGNPCMLKAELYLHRWEAFLAVMPPRNPKITQLQNRIKLYEEQKAALADQVEELNTAIEAAETEIEEATHES